MRLLQPKYGGMIIDIVSRDTRTPEQQSDALEAVKNTVLYIVLIVVVGYAFSFFSFHVLLVMVLFLVVSSLTDWNHQFVRHLTKWIYLVLHKI